MLTRISAHRRHLIIRRVLNRDLHRLHLTSAHHTRRSRQDSEALQVLRSNAQASCNITRNFSDLILSSCTTIGLLLGIRRLLTFTLRRTHCKCSHPTTCGLNCIINYRLLTCRNITTLHQLRLILCETCILFRDLRSTMTCLDRALMITFTLNTLDLRLRLLRLLLILLGLIRRTLLTLPFYTRHLLLITRFNSILIRLLCLLNIILTLSDLTLGLRLLRSTHGLIRLLKREITLRTRLYDHLIRGIGNLIKRRSIKSMALQGLRNDCTNIILCARLIIILMTLLRSTRSESDQRLIELISRCNLRAALRDLILLRMLLMLIRHDNASTTRLTAHGYQLRSINDIRNTFTATHAGGHIGLISRRSSTAI